MRISDRLPKIKAAALLIARDHGMINRFETEEEMYEKLDGLLGAEGVYEAELQEIEAYFEGLQEVQFTVLCTEGPTAITGPENEKAEGLLNDIFENL